MHRKRPREGRTTSQGVFVTLATEDSADSTEQADALAHAAASQKKTGAGWLIAIPLIVLVTTVMFFWATRLSVLLLLLIVPCVLMRRRAQRLKASNDGAIKDMINAAGLEPTEAITQEEVHDDDSAAETPRLVYKSLLPVPTKDKGGPRYLWWKLRREKKFKHTGDPKYLMRPSIRNRIAQLDPAIRKSASKIESMFIVTLNQGGGACKTTVAAMLAVFFAKITQKETLLLDANQAMGTTADVVKATDAPSLNHAMDTYFANPSMSPAHRTNVYGHHPSPGYGSLLVLRSVTDDEREQLLVEKDLPEDAPIHSRLQHGQFNQEEARQRPANFADNGNSLNQPVVKATTDVGTFGIFTAKGTDGPKIKLCRDTIRFYRRTMPDFVAKRCIVVVSAVADYTDEQLRAAYAVYYGVSPSRVVFTEFDDFLSIDRNRRLTPQQIEGSSRPYEVNTQSLRNQCAWREILNKIQEMILDPALEYTPPGPTATTVPARAHKNTATLDSAAPDEAIPPVDTKGAGMALQTIGG